MSNTTPTGLGEGYVTVAYPYKGTVYNFSFYEGFVSRILLRPEGGEPVEVFKQKGTYYVPQPQSGELRYPDEYSTVMVVGGPSELDIELGVDDGPQVKGRGPIKKIKLRTKKKDKDASDQAPGQAKGKGPSVSILKGADQVESLSVEMKDGRGASRGGVEAFQTSGGGGDEVVVENNAETCPPDCP